MAGRPEEAVASADEALAVDPQNAAAWQQKGVSLASLGRSDEAASALEQAAFLAPRDAAPRVALAVLLGRLGRLSQSLAAYDRAVDADPDHVDVWLERGKTLADAGLLADAAGALLRFLDLTPAHHPARPRAEELLREAQEGVASAPAPEPPAAEPVVPRESSLVPEPGAEDSAPAAPEPSFIPDASEPDRPAPVAAPMPAWDPEPPKAAPEPPPLAGPPRPHLDSRPDPEPEPLRASQPPPEPGPAPQPRAAETERVPETESAPEAGRDPEPEPQPAPTDAVGWSARGISLFKAGRLDHALRAFDQAISAEGRSASHWANRASVLFRLGRPEEALAGLARALALDPRLASSWFNKATIEKALGRPAEAARSLLELLALHPPPDARLVEQARSLQAEIEGQGGPPAPQGALGFLRAGLQAAEAGHLEDAVAAFGSALADDPLLPGAWLLKGDALAHLGRDTEAAQAYEEGLAADPSDTRLLLGFARSRARLGDLDMATAVLSRCLEIATGEAHQAAQRLLAAVEARRRAAATPAEPADSRATTTGRSRAPVRRRARPPRGAGADRRSRARIRARSRARNRPRSGGHRGARPPGADAPTGATRTGAACPCATPADSATRGRSAARLPAAGRSLARCRSAYSGCFTFRGGSSAPLPFLCLMPFPWPSALLRSPRRFPTPPAAPRPCSRRGGLPTLSKSWSRPWRPGSTTPGCGSLEGIACAFSAARKKRRPASTRR